MAPYYCRMVNIWKVAFIGGLETQTHSSAQLLRDQSSGLSRVDTYLLPFAILSVANTPSSYSHQSSHWCMAPRGSIIFIHAFFIVYPYFGLLIDCYIMNWCASVQVQRAGEVCQHYTARACIAPLFLAITPQLVPAIESIPLWSVHCKICNRQ